MKGCWRNYDMRHGERGVTILFVAIAMVAIIGMAALSIDVVVLYLAKEEAQRSADQAALAAARILSVSGITGDPANSTGNWGAICGANGVATHAAQAVVAQNTVGRAVPGTINVTYSAGVGGAITSSTDCQTLGGANSAFGVNPMVTVQLTLAGMPTFFSRIWGNSGNSVSATATAEAFNPSFSARLGNQASGTVTPVQPRCVKPWVVPNLDPRDPAHPGCTTNCVGFVDRLSGAIQRPGISLNGTGATGVIGETFWLPLDCKHGNPNYCDIVVQPTMNGANYTDPAGSMHAPPNLLGLPGQVGTPVTAVASCSGGDDYGDAVAGCDSSANYQCGVPNANAVDLTKHNPGVNRITDSVECLIHQTDATNLTTSSGQDYLSETPLGQPPSYPFQIFAGSSNPMGASPDTPVMSSASIVTMPIYDQIGTPNIPTNAITNLTFIGFLQVFVNAVDVNGNRLVTVLNVSGCGNGTNPTGNPITGTSPVPTRLITPP